jgi:hypothetical protein
VEFPYPGVKQFYSVFFENMRQYKEHLKTINKRLVQEYEYILYVPSVPGFVAGLYVQFTTDLPTTKRRLKRMLRCRTLKVKNLTSNDYDLWVRMMDDEWGA